MKVVLLFILFLSNIIIISNESLNCDGEIIDHCKKCNTGENSDSCAECEDKYFLFFNNLLCLPCNDLTYGQIGCDGNCDGSDYAQTRFAFCEIGKCKEGYSNYNGLCFECGINSPGCANCSYVVQESQTNGTFICHNCVSNEYKLSEFGTCEHCNINNCEKCHFNNTRAECDKCVDGYYKDSNGYCKQCYTSYIRGGRCLICSDNETDYESGNCWCDSGYYLSGHSKCESCPNRCSYCQINNITNNIECLDCFSHYALNPNNTCIFCGEGCAHCELDENLYPVCLSCYSGKFLDNNKCLVCSSGCSKCTIESTSNLTICNQCSYRYALNPEKTCTWCKLGNGTGGEGCSTCVYNEDKLKYDCLSCENNNYAFINNLLQCLPNYDISQVYLYGCLKANYDEIANKFECLQCKTDFTKIQNDNTCRKLSEIGISSGCLEVINLKTPDDPLYSCNKCEESFAIITSINIGNKNCYYRRNNPNFFYCLEGEIEQNGTETCTKCVDHASLNSSGICECNSNSFGQNNSLCYECDDKSKGNSGCLASKGCNYIHSNDELDCNECKDGYFNYTRGQCFSCENEIPNCEKCHFDSKLICDKCSNFYLPNDKKGKCVLNECEEYPEIAPGCIICQDKFSEYYSQKKCQSCKYGYFKTKEESCVYCRAEENGGPFCFECGYEIDESGNEGNNIICKDCFSIDQYTNANYFYYYEEYQSIPTSALSSKGKCYNCQSSISNSCLKCEFANDKNNNEKLMCTICRPGYYVDSDGKCVNFLNKLQIIPNCEKHAFNIDNYHFYFYIDVNTIEDGYYSHDNYYNYSYYNEILKNAKAPINTICTRCKDGYHLIEEGKCENISIDISKCTGNLLVQNSYSNDYMMDICHEFCNDNRYPTIYLSISNGSIDYENMNYNLNNERSLLSIFQILNNMTQYDDSVKYIALNSSLCIDISDANYKSKFNGCLSVIYIPKNNSYKCIQCDNNYILDYTTYLCNERNYNNEYNYYINNEGINCKLENIGSESSPLYSCEACNNNQIMVTYENGAKVCIDKEEKLEGCIEANATTEYENPIYHCNSCEFNYVPYYSKFFGRKICHNAFEKIIKKKNISLDLFKNEDFIENKKQKWLEDKYFTPDNKNWYECKNKNVGMVGCLGKCNFSLTRNDPLICQGKCKEGYIETSKGICQSCGSVNEGCNECEYTDKYPDNYYNVKKKRRFQCKFCKPGFNLIDGKCYKCSDLGFSNCDECGKDEITGYYKCTKCSKYYYLNYLGNCSDCIIRRVEFNNKCQKCNHVKDYCRLCLINENKNDIICKKCFDDYILFTNNNTCIPREINDKIKEFDSCLELKLEDGKYVCTRCKPQYSFLEINGELKCTEIPTLFNYYQFSYYYYKNYTDIFKDNKYEKTEKFLFHYLYKHDFLYPCKEAINLGTKDNPRYSCNKCFDLFDNEEFDNIYYDNYADGYGYYYFLDEYIYQFNDYSYYLNYGHPIKITETGSNISYCMKANTEAKNCTEATYKISNGKAIFNCTKCLKDNLLKYDKELNINYCKYNINTAANCMVNYCKNCLSDNFYFCSDCITSDFEVNKITGSCVKKTEVIPAVTWKDVYRLQMNQEKEISGKIITGPSLTLRGITNSQINSGHAFLVYLTFKIKNGLRNLEEEKKIPAFCQIDESVEESKNDVNFVDYECIGDTDFEMDENYILNGIEEGDNDGVFISNNFDTIKNADLANLKNETSARLNNLTNLIIFKVNEESIINQTSSNNKFNFSLYGSLNQDPEVKKLTDLEIPVREIENKTAKCDFYSDDNLNASLICGLELNSDDEIKNITFKSNEVDLKHNNKILYIPSLNYIYLFRTQNEDVEEIEKEKTNHNTLIAVLCSVIGVLALAGLGIVIYYKYITTKAKPSKIINSNNINETQTHNKNSQSDINLNK